MTAAASGPPVRTVFIGTGTFAVPALRALASAPGVALVGVVTAPARAAGRGGALRESAVSEAARSLGLAPILAPDRLRRPESVDAVLALRPGLIVLADYGQIVPAALLEVRHGALNLHPSLLPRHRGASPIPATILAGESRTGVALMRMDAGLDTGPLIAVEEVPLRGDELAPDLERALAERGAALLVRSLRPWLFGQVAAQPQAVDGATLTRPLRRDDGRLDPTRPATDLERQVRAFQPWPGSWFEVSSTRIAAWRVAVRPDLGLEPGRLVGIGQALALQTGSGSLDLLEVQPAGGRRMSGGELLRGRPGILSQLVGPAPSDHDRGPVERPVGYSTLP